MSVGLYPVYDREISNAGFADSDGTMLISNALVLDEVASELGVRKFSSYWDNRPVPKGFDGEPNELFELLGEWDEWFSPFEGIATLSALVNAFRSQPSLAARLDDAEGVIDDLQALADCLKSAQEQGALFRWELW